MQLEEFKRRKAASLANKQQPRPPSGSSTTANRPAAVPQTEKATERLAPAAQANAPSSSQVIQFCIDKFLMCLRELLAGLKARKRSCSSISCPKMCSGQNFKNERRLLGPGCFLFGDSRAGCKRCHLVPRKEFSCITEATNIPTMHFWVSKQESQSGRYSKGDTAA